MSCNCYNQPPNSLRCCSAGILQPFSLGEVGTPGEVGKPLAKQYAVVEDARPPAASIDLFILG